MTEQMDLFNSVCQFQVAKIFNEGKPEYRYFETYEEARSNAEQDKIALLQFLKQNNKGRYVTFEIKHGRDPFEEYDDESEQAPPPFHVLLERAINAREAKARRLQRLGVASLPEFAKVPNLAWYYGRWGKKC